MADTYKIKLELWLNERLQVLDLERTKLTELAPSLYSRERANAGQELAYRNLLAEAASSSSLEYLRSYVDQALRETETSLAQAPSESNPAHAYLLGQAIGYRDVRLTLIGLG